jgi:DNA ligase-1
MLRDSPAGVRAYDILMLDGEDLRTRSFADRRTRLEEFIATRKPPRFDLSPLVPFKTWDELREQRANPPSAAVEGVMLKRKGSPYLPGRVKGEWWKWKRDPHLVDAVLMYAQRGHGKRSSFYSDYTFGVWKGEELVPVGKAYFGFTDEELVKIDRFVRAHTTNKFGPVREVTHDRTVGLVFEVAFEGLARSTRHKSGVAMRFPRINRLRWDKPPSEADTIDTLERMLK